MTEKQPYRVISEHDGYEVRLYPAHILAQVDADGSFFEAGNQGFRPLIRYISASNISMTAPVIQSPGQSKRYTVSFVMPAGATSVPAPRDATVRTVDVPEQRVAARRFSGGSNEDRYQENADALLAALTRDGCAPLGSVYFARYDPPWKPGFLKRNEALVVVR
ncbi:heme-binding protein [Salinibacterium sp. NG253]|uniref:SOUL family heme-binding protein n=1 Tax=Salinibacterium sp. NG253 TaxID=2792039 RepID=UPI0018CE37F3|nr:heme-binding protein [Salinibacterium sp. NG253]MBH0117585.1 heme-binding protein [Salinibacterium sp. NG253]